MQLRSRSLIGRNWGSKPSSRITRSCRSLPWLRTHVHIDPPTPQNIQQPTTIMGLFTLNGEFIACGSETNEVFVYEISNPVTWHRFGLPDADDPNNDSGSYFISGVCWKSDSLTVLTANSQGPCRLNGSSKMATAEIGGISVSRAQNTREWHLAPSHSV